MDKQIRFNYQSSRQRDDNSEGTRVLLDFALSEPDYEKEKKKKEACVEVNPLMVGARSSGGGLRCS